MTSKTPKLCPKCHCKFRWEEDLVTGYDGWLVCKNDHWYSFRGGELSRVS